ncbi:TIGR03089 family protein [Amycolatopsis xylanica]|uniref:TIGR03089 family protein n=1 Tax=Amycolatopsis xylanica TaxID=589385 RepID=A0A1H3M6Z3_9PSEU|nr:TIGR03089 family protein [Amycolatopsis xylanica]
MFVSLTEHLLRPLLASPARPLITHYDDATGSRIELSVATTVNWAAKTANWLVEEADVEAGDEVGVRLPAHWQTAGVLLGAWWCGAQVVTEAPGVTFVAPGETSSASLTPIVAMDPFGMGMGVTGGLNFLADVKMYGDDFSPLFPIPGDSPALLSSTVDEVIAEARSRAAKLGITSADRVLSTVEWTFPDGVLDGLLAPLSVGAHLVHVSNANPEKLADRRAAERTTVDLLA